MLNKATLMDLSMVIDCSVASQVDTHNVTNFSKITSNALLYITENMSYNTDQSHFVAATLLDLCKAFDSIQQPILFDKSRSVCFNRVTDLQN